MFFDLAPYKEAVVTSLPLGTGVKIPLTIGTHPNQILTDWLSWRDSIKGFWNNRGRMVVSPKTFNTCRKQFNPILLVNRVCVLSDDGKFLILADGHSSTMGAFCRYYDGNMTPSELAAPFTLEIKPFEWLEELYAGLNDGDPHKSKQRVDNPSQAYGYLIHRELAPLLAEKSINFLGLDRTSDKQGMLTTLSQLIFALHHGPTFADSKQLPWRSTTCYATRGKSTKLQNNPAGSLKLGRVQIEALAKQLDSYCELWEEVRANAGKMNINPLLRLKPFFYLIVTEKLGKNCPIPKKNKSLAANIAKNYSKIDSIARICTHGPLETQEGYRDQLVRLLNGKSK